jgi:AmmeMemoRadiSam system protein B
MIKNRVISHSWLPLLLAILVLGFAWQSLKPNTQVVVGEASQARSAPDNNDSYRHPIAFYDPELVGKGITFAAQNASKPEYQIRGAIVPHHTFATHLIAEVFSQLATQNPASVIIIGPNHYERGGFNVLSSEYPWQTAFGDLTPQKDFVAALETRGLVRQQPEVLSQDHALSALMPYLKYYLPHAKVLPLLLSAHTTSAELDVLSQSVYELQQPETVVVAAVDFSHYLSSAQAKQKDHETWQIMSQFNYEQLMRLTNQHVDSPASIALLLKLMQLAGSTQSELLANTNSGELTGEINAPTTSYFTVLYH